MYGVRSRRAAVVAVLLLVALTGCSNSSGEPPSPSPTESMSSPSVGAPNTSRPLSPSPSASLTLTAEEQAAAEASLGAYRGFVQAQTAAEASADPNHPDLAKFAEDKALAGERVNLMEMERNGIVVRGLPKIDPQVVSVTLGDRPEVVLSDCVDLTDAQPIYADSGKSAAAPGQADRIPATIIVRPYKNGWYVMESTADRSRTC